MKKNKLLVLTMLPVLALALTGCETDEDNGNSNNSSNSMTKTSTRVDMSTRVVGLVKLPKYITTDYANALISQGKSFSAIAVDPQTKCEYFVNANGIYNNTEGAVATKSTWQPRYTKDRQIVTYSGNVNALK